MRRDFLPQKVVVLGGARTPIGSFLGALRAAPAARLAAAAAAGALQRSGVAPAEIQQCLVGQVIASGQGKGAHRLALQRSGKCFSNISPSVAVASSPAVLAFAAPCLWGLSACCLLLPFRFRALLCYEVPDMFILCFPFTLGLRRLSHFPPLFFLISPHPTCTGRSWGPCL